MTKNKNIAIQNVSGIKQMPTQKQLRAWCAAVLMQQKYAEADICIRIVSPQEMAALNRTYRGKQGSTNVLSFPAARTGTPLLGDIVLCAMVINREAIEQEKTRAAHWAHMVIHGTLHLLGHDHEKPVAARNMEALEVRILHQHGFNNPYN